MFFSVVLICPSPQSDASFPFPGRGKEEEEEEEEAWRDRGYKLVPRLLLLLFPGREETNELLRKQAATSPPPQEPQSLTGATLGKLEMGPLDLLSWRKSSQKSA